MIVVDDWISGSGVNGVFFVGSTSMDRGVGVAGWDEVV
jgi:hypothetical protein